VYGPGGHGRGLRTTTLPEMIFIVSAALLLVLALVIGRSWLLAVPLIAWPAYMFGLRLGWWGSGVGDGWQYGLVWGTVAGLLIAGLGVALHSVVARARGRRGSHDERLNRCHPDS
jgi:hypothetical protein